MFTSKKRKLGSSREPIDFDGKSVVCKLLNCFGEHDPTAAMDNLSLLLEDLGLPDFSFLLKLPEVLQAFQVDIFWIIHLNGFIVFLDYIRLVDKSTIVGFIRRNYIATAATSISDDDDPFDSIPLSICADITLYLFNMTKANDHGNTTDADIQKISNILNQCFLPNISNGPLQPSDIQLFSDILATISCSIEHEAVQEMQIDQISNILSYEIRTYRSTTAASPPVTHPSPASEEYDSASVDRECQAVNNTDPFSCLWRLRLPAIIFLKAFDRVLRAENRRSPFDPEFSKSLMTNTAPGVYSALYLFFECASRDGLLSWKSSSPQAFNTESIARHAATLLHGSHPNQRNGSLINGVDAVGILSSSSSSSYNSRAGSNSNLSSGSRSGSCSFLLVSMIHLATSCAIAGITESSQSLWLRAVCLAEQVSRSLQHIVPKGETDPGSALFADWLSFILNPPKKNILTDEGSSGVCNEENNLNLLRSDESDLRVNLGSTGGVEVAAASLKSLEFVCLSLCSCIPYQQDSTLQVVCHTLRAIRPLAKEVVDIYLHNARDRMRQIDILKASSTPTQKSPITLDAPRVTSWIGTLRRTGSLPAGVFQVCKMGGTNGYKGLLMALQILALENQSIREGCQNIVRAMVLTDPPLCSNDEAGTFFSNIKGDTKGRTSIESFLSGISFSPVVRCTLESGFQVLVHSSATITRKEIYSMSTRDLMLNQWKSSCSSVLDLGSYLEFESRFRNKNGALGNSSNNTLHSDALRAGGQSSNQGRGGDLRDNLNHLRAATALCSAVFQMLTLVAEMYLGYDAAIPSSFSSSSSSCSSSSSASSSSSSSTEIMAKHCEPHESYLRSWYQYNQVLCSVLVSSNDRLIVGILAATIASEIVDSALRSISPPSSTSFSSSFSSSSDPLNSMKLDLSFILASVDTDRQVQSVLDLVVNQLLPSRDLRGTSDPAFEGSIKERRLLVLCDVLYGTIMWHLIALQGNKEGSGSRAGTGTGTATELGLGTGSGPVSGAEIGTGSGTGSGSGTLDPNDGIFNSQSAHRIGEVIRNYPFLCGLFIWTRTRCVTFTDLYRDIPYGSSAYTNSVLENWTMLESKITNYIWYRNSRGMTSSREDTSTHLPQEHARTVSTSTSKGDYLADKVVKILLSPELTFFLRWECTYDKILYVRLADRAKTFQTIWNIFIAADTEGIVGQNSGRNPGSGSSEETSVAYLKSVWRVLLQCVTSLIDWSSHNMTHNSLLSGDVDTDLSSASARLQSSNGYPSSAGMSSGLLTIPCIVKDAISLLVLSLLESTVASRTEDGPVLPFRAELGKV
jgi:hypothetical protein